MNQPVAGCREKVDATVDSAVRYWPLAVDMQLFLKVLLILLVDILYNGLPAAGRHTAVIQLVLMLVWVFFRSILLKSHVEVMLTVTFQEFSPSLCCRVGSDRHLPVLVIDLVSKSRSVSHRQLHSHPFLLNDWT